jgi:hypothetical protein
MDYSIFRKLGGLLAILFSAKIIIIITIGPMAPWAILGDSPNRVSWLVPNVCFEPGKQCGQYSANVHYGMTLHRSQLDFFAIHGHVKNPGSTGSTIYIHFEDTSLSKYTQILRFEQKGEYARRSLSHTSCDECSCLRKQ